MYLRTPYLALHKDPSSSSSPNSVSPVLGASLPPPLIAEVLLCCPCSSSSSFHSLAPLLSPPHSTTPRLAFRSTPVTFSPRGHSHPASSSLHVVSASSVFFPPQPSLRTLIASSFPFHLARLADKPQSSLPPLSHPNPIPLRSIRHPKHLPSLKSATSTKSKRPIAKTTSQFSTVISP
ncbi:uncharacterized protein LY79DRAFT_144843 [Colletotrichum navitas]|uniref:Uncharacterized protein n=1 Tax=Colletotrichum navitas TaxID=681940 RepID=A0AAD8QBY3_9PEZI|nr:uncharacterized protein LY79DRAFT_144843 [Colletotrichum navitas]KAK1599575.1 hypothetical protein LY79DRAFT_144843 [Colletotrichum navitas]